MPPTYHTANIRALLTQGFDDQKLRQLAYDWPEFRPAYEKLAAGTRKDVLVQLLIEQAERSLQLDQLLALAQRLNPARYALHQPYFDRPQLEAELATLEAAQASLRGILPPDQLAAMQAKQSNLHALLTGSGGLAQGDGAVGVGQQGQAVVNSPGAQVTYIGKQEFYQTAEPTSKVSKTFEVSAARTSYLEALARKCNVLPLAALGGEEGAEEDLTLDRIYIELDTTTPVPLTEAEKEARQKERLLGRDSDTRPLTALEAAAQYPRLALLGDPGAGKSTFAHKLLAWQAAAVLKPEVTPPPGLSPDLLPILITLRDLAPRLAALELAALPAERQTELLAAAVRDQALADLERLEAADFAPDLRQAFTSGQCLLVLDGLDETPYDLRPLVRQAVSAVISRYQAKRLIVTCRVRSYVGQAKLPRFSDHTLAPFDEAKITAFVAAWYQAQQALGRFDSVQTGERVNNLTQAALAEEMRELAENPMLLTTMAIIHQREVTLPRERARLYHQAVEVLLSRWQKSKSGLTPSPALAVFLKDDLRLRQVMERLAYEAHRARDKTFEVFKTSKVSETSKGLTTDLPRGGALTLLEKAEYLGQPGLAGEFLDYVDQRAGLLVGRGGEPGHPASYSFPHRTFQEYLAGCYMISRGDPAREYFARAAEGDDWGLAAQLGAEDLLYRRQLPENLLALAYRLAPATEPTTPQARRALLWAGRMAALVGAEALERDTDSPDGGPAYLERLQPRLLALFNSDLTLPERAAAGLTLGRLNDPRPGVLTLPPALTPEISGKFWYGEGKDKKLREVAPFQAGVYGVTNAQFEQFWRDKGYDNQNWWSEAGWQWRTGKPRYDWQKLDRPDFWDNPRFNAPNQPVVGVSWYEAEAFCNWLSATYGRPYRLPTEEEWERLARGTEGWVYPWGNEWQEGAANTAESKLGQTTTVGLFAPNPAGAYDCVGNVWEWGADWYDKKEQMFRVLRGGSWNIIQVNARCVSRARTQADNSSVDIGFRVVSPILS